jgi:hypothetical protein
MNVKQIAYAASLLWLMLTRFAAPQSLHLQGQLSGWGNSNPAQIGVRYLPELLADYALPGQWRFDGDFALNVFAASELHEWSVSRSESRLKPYRMWVRFATNRFELRGGLQKINFGPAVLFRSLQWFDRLDPRDPLQLTEGVYGVLMRYYLQNNANFWVWGLYGNEDPKGLEFVPTADNTIEFGGRWQQPIANGEAGLTFHRRRAELPKGLLPSENRFDETRLALDGKWDVQIGIWLETAVIFRDIAMPELKYQRLLTIGADYTFATGNGLHVLSEFFTTADAFELFGGGTQRDFWGFSADYPLGLLDNIAGYLFRDLTSRQNFFSLIWQRTYDRWQVNLIGYLTPETAPAIAAQNFGNTIRGNGLQLLVVFNH